MRLARLNSRENNDDSGGEAGEQAENISSSCYFVRRRRVFVTVATIFRDTREKFVLVAITPPVTEITPGRVRFSTRTVRSEKAVTTAGKRKQCR